VNPTPWRWRWLHFVSIYVAFPTSISSWASEASELFCTLLPEKTSKKHELGRGLEIEKCLARLSSHLVQASLPPQAEDLLSLLKAFQLVKMKGLRSRRVVEEEAIKNEFQKPFRHFCR